MSRYTKKAFTMLELVFVIVILGIVASMSSELIANVYKSYVLQKAQHNANLKTEIAVTQASNRLQNALRFTVSRVKADGSLESAYTISSTTGDEYVGIQWVGADYESYASASKPGWSGFCDVNNSSQDTISTPGSDLDFTNTVIDKLSNGTKGIADAVIYFRNDTNTTPNGVASSSSGEQIDLDSSTSFISEHYKLAWTSYALVVEDGDLYLYYNFPPTPNANRNDGIKSLVLKNVTTFKMKVEGQTIRLKICKQERISENADDNVTSCKEKAVF